MYVDTETVLCIDGVRDIKYDQPGTFLLLFICLDRPTPAGPYSGMCVDV